MRDQTAIANEQLALRVNEAMQRANIPEDELAQETHIPGPRLRRILDGNCDSTTFFEIVAFAVVFGQSVDSLLS